VFDACTYNNSQCHTHPHTGTPPPPPPLLHPPPNHCYLGGSHSTLCRHHGDCEVVQVPALELDAGQGHGEPQGQRHRVAGPLPLYKAGMSHVDTHSMHIVYNTHRPHARTMHNPHAHTTHRRSLFKLLENSEPSLRVQQHMTVCCRVQGRRHMHKHKPPCPSAHGPRLHTTIVHAPGYDTPREQQACPSHSTTGER
jgi:hypothetical protein